LTKLLEFKTNDAFALKYQVETYYMMGRYKESLADLNKLLEINTNDTWTLKAYEEVVRECVYNNLFIFILNIYIIRTYCFYKYTPIKLLGSMYYILFT